MGLKNPEDPKCQEVPERLIHQDNLYDVLREIEVRMLEEIKTIDKQLRALIRTKVQQRTLLRVKYLVKKFSFTAEVPESELATPDIDNQMDRLILEKEIIRIKMYRLSAFLISAQTGKANDISRDKVFRLFSS